MIVENIQEKSSDKVIVNLFREGRKDDYSEDVNLSESDIFLLYCKLLEEKTQVQLFTSRTSKKNRQRQEKKGRSEVMFLKNIVILDTLTNSEALKT